MSEEKKLARKYRACSLTIYTILTVLVLILYFMTGSMLAWLAFIPTIFVSFLISTALYRKFIFASLYDECDPEKYYRIMTEGKFKVAFKQDEIIYAVNTGDFSRAISLIESGITVAPKSSVGLLVEEARIYLHLQDTEKLKETYARLDSALNQHKKGEKLRASIPFCKFVELYLQGNFEELEAFYAPIISQKRFNTHAWRAIHTRYSYALAALKAGKVAEAKEAFLFVKEKGEKTLWGRSASEYLLAIENGTEVEKPEYQVVIDPSATVDSSVRLRRILFGAFALVLGIILFTNFMDINNMLRNRQYEKRINYAITKEYGDVEFELLAACQIFDMEMKAKDKYVNSFAVYAIDDKIYLAPLWSYDKDDNRAELFLHTSVEMKVDETYTLAAYPENYNVTFVFTQGKKKPKKYQQDFSFKYEKQRYYLYVTEVVPFKAN